MWKLTRRAALLGAGAALGVWGAGRFGPSLPSLAGNAMVLPTGSDSTLNDASRLSETPIHRHITLSEDVGEALVNKLRGELEDAKAGNRPVALSAARHSLGGQSIPRDGHAITCDNGFVEPDTANATFRVHAGARWSQVIAALDPLGFSPKVMQSNRDFGVGATFCVNAHGWPAPNGPMGSTVREFRMVTHDGDWITCSRRENAALFAMTMGGYGLIGLITDLTLDMTPNRRLNPKFVKLRSTDLGTAFAAALEDPVVEMAYGRLNVDRDRFFEDGLLATYRPDADQSDLPPVTGSGRLAGMSRDIFRAQLGNEAVKRGRWFVESNLGPLVGGGATTRNSLLNEPVVTLDARVSDRTDILQEYFIAPDRFADFVLLCQQVIPESYQELLNITLRYVAADTESWLSYAPEPRIAAVMLFSQEMTARGESDMARMTQALIEGVINIAGTYYLPYRLHATQDQFTRAYPRAAEFAAAKRRIDPDLRFRNALWDSYMKDL
ncbi:FAD-binding oxidoreductase [Oceaniovalibus sp. ACAM 378]|uniref:FAD-binding oxidoreductase n=1 Tax=Oceaniovalibus sp. ACAM 378 TaxID=2599923 RepID=UPI0011D5C05A|nr:FAD-binding oxidoreductase [Oceaniovalibus sp. ACAM 378]TYB89141.1 FAD-binding oxidoreductase [Oceaniovalibus sp. ACAM 378]